jgi:hypothetical protein
MLTSLVFLAITLILCISGAYYFRHRKLESAGEMVAPMKFLLAGILLIQTACAFAKDAPVKGGESPDGQYEVRVYQTTSRAPSDYCYGVVDRKSGKLIKELSEGGGFCMYDGALQTASVLWHSSSHFFALVDHDGRHSMAMFVYGVSPKGVTLISQPDYYQNALGRVGATEGYLIGVVRPSRWDKDDLFSDLIFDARTPDGERSPVYHVGFTLRLSHPANMDPSLGLVSMGKPTADE